MNKTDVGENRVFNGVMSGLVIGTMFGSSIIFFLKASSYPASSEIQLDYAGAALVFTFVYHHAIWRISRNLIVFMMAMFALPLMGIISAAGCSAACVQIGDSIAIPFQVILIPLIGALVFVVFAVLYMVFEQKIDQWEERYKTYGKEKKKNDYAGAAAVTVNQLETDDLSFNGGHTHPHRQTDQKRLTL